MSSDEVNATHRSGRAVDRLINFSDSVVAVAVTVLVLPLVNIPGPADNESVWSVISLHANQINTFIFTFFVVTIMWLAHNRILNELCAYDVTLFWLNTCWLASIVILPWVSSMYGAATNSADDRLGDQGLLYWGALAGIGIFGTLMGWHISRHPELDNGATQRQFKGRTSFRGPVFVLYFILLGVVSVYSWSTAGYLELGIIPLTFIFRPTRNADSVRVSREGENP